MKAIFLFCVFLLSLSSTLVHADSKNKQIDLKPGSKTIVEQNVTTVVTCSQPSVAPCAIERGTYYYHVVQNGNEVARFNTFEMILEAYKKLQTSGICP